MHGRSDNKASVPEGFLGDARPDDPSSRARAPRQRARSSERKADSEPPELDLKMAGPPTTREKLIRKIKRSKNDRFERELAFQIRSHKLPQPHEQFRFATDLLTESGRPRQLRSDFAWPQYHLLCEVIGGIWMRGGGGHSHPMHIGKDIERQQIATLLGWFILPVTTDEVKNGKAIALLERVLASRGWTRE